MPEHPVPVNRGCMVGDGSSARITIDRSIDPIIPGSRLQIDEQLYNNADRLPPTIVSIRSLKHLSPLRSSSTLSNHQPIKNTFKHAADWLSAEFRRPILIANSRIWSRRGTFTTITNHHLAQPTRSTNSRANREFQRRFHSRSSARCLRDKFDVEKLNLCSRGKRQDASVYPLHPSSFFFFFLFRSNESKITRDRNVKLRGRF